MPKQPAKSVKCVRDARAYPPACFSLPRDGRKAKRMCEQRRSLFIQYATYADGDGTRAFPGVKKLARECGFSERTTKRLIADLNELGCVVEAVGPDGKIKLHGPRGTTERVVSTAALPAPGSTAWEPTADNKVIRFVFEPGMSCTFDKDGNPMWMGASPVGPDTKPVGPNSAAVGPDTIAVGPKSADFGPQPPRITATGTDTTTATAPTAGLAGARAGLSPKSAGTATPKADWIIEKFVWLEERAMPASKKVKQEIEAMVAGVPQSVIEAALVRWCNRREAGFSGLKDPARRMLEELPGFIKLAQQQ